jgi:hypothetical protein
MWFAATLGLVALIQIGMPRLFTAPDNSATAALAGDPIDDQSLPVPEACGVACASARGNAWMAHTNAPPAGTGGQTINASPSTDGD